jgi:hypothetical protein
MNEIVKQHYPACRLPDDLRPSALFEPNPTGITGLIQKIG